MLLYDILQLQISAPEAEIDQAYRTLARCTFQDFYLLKNTDFCAVSDAYYILKQHRNEYLSTTDRDSRDFFSYVQPSLPHPVRQYLRNYGVCGTAMNEHSIVHLTCTSEWERTSFPGIAVSQRAKRLMERPQWYTPLDSHLEANEATFLTALESDTTRALSGLRESKQKRYFRQVLTVLDEIWKQLRALEQKKEDFDTYVNLRCVYFAVFLYARTLSSELDKSSSPTDMTDTSYSLNAWCCPSLDPISAEVHAMLLELGLDPTTAEPKNMANVKIELMQNRSLLTKERMLNDRDILQQRHEQQRTPLKLRLMDGATSDPIFGVPVVLLECLGKDVAGIKKDLRDRRRPSTGSNDHGKPTTPKEPKEGKPNSAKTDPIAIPAATKTKARAKNDEKGASASPEDSKTRKSFPIVSPKTLIPKMKADTDKKTKKEGKNEKNEKNTDKKHTQKQTDKRKKVPRSVSSPLKMPSVTEKPVDSWSELKSDDETSTLVEPAPHLRQRASEYGFFNHDVDFLVSS
ncbi:hypothetical protein CJU89_0063 [Yarrowia sp. B02]|nr:hypothetical protein CJU89_0063 [Yarrowia sp. B02]